MEKLLRRIWHLVVRLMEWVFRLLHIHLSEGQWEALKQFVKFGMIGVTNTAVSYCIYLAVLLFLQSRNLFPDTDYLIGNVLSFLLSVLWSFYWNRRFVFRPEEGRTLSWPQALLKTYISYAFTGLVLNNILSVVLVGFFGVSKLIAPILNLLISVPVNFLLNKFWGAAAVIRQESRIRGRLHPAEWQREPVNRKQRRGKRLRSRKAGEVRMDRREKKGETI